jgi:purine-binding chemotaxis protein CheW
VSETTTEFVTVQIGEQWFGIPINRVHDVFRPQRLTRVPLSHPNIAGVLNLRGRIVTMIDCRSRLGLGPRAADAQPMAAGVERNGEFYGRVIDAVGEVLNLPPSAIGANPVNLDAKWRAISKGVYRLEGRLLVVLDVDALLDFTNKREAA